MSRIKFWDDTAEPLPADFSWPTPLPDITLHHLVPKLGYRATLLSRACRRHALQNLALTDSLVEVVVNRLVHEPTSSIRLWTYDLLLAVMRLLNLDDLSRTMGKLFTDERDHMTRICVRFVAEVVLPRKVDWFTREVFCCLCVTGKFSGALLLSSCSPMREWIFEEIDEKTRHTTSVEYYFPLCRTFFDLLAATLPAPKLMARGIPRTFRQRVPKTCFECVYRYNKPALEVLLRIVPQPPSPDDFDDPELRLYLRMRSLRGVGGVMQKTAIGSRLARTIAGVLVNIPSSPQQLVPMLPDAESCLVLLLVSAVTLVFHFVWLPHLHL